MTRKATAIRSLGIGTAALLLLAAFAGAAVPPQSEKAKVTAIEERINAGFAAGDADAVAAQYTEDAMLMPPSAPSLVGRAAIADSYRAFFQGFKCIVKTEPQEVEVAGDWAVLRGVLTSTVTPKAGGEPHVNHGKYIAIARRGADGVWRFSRDIYNMDSPPGPR
jgi:uncharacterized protein (TIGR02246 family)